MQEIDNLITTLENYKISSSQDSDFTQQIIDWIKKYREFAFVKANLEGHITGSMMITNPAKTKVLLMLHKKFQRWQQFGWHCDGDTDVRNVAIREFHEESGIIQDPKILDPLFQIDIHDIPIDKKLTPSHKHFDIMFLGIIDENIPFFRQESEVDDIRWFDIEWIEKYVEKEIFQRIQKIHIFL